MHAIAAVVLLLLVYHSSAQSSADLSSAYQFNANLHERYTLFWSINHDAETIRFAVRVRTTGWVGFGISPNGQMPESDVVIGWVDNAGTSYFDDRFADTRSLPPVDEEQDWFLTSASEQGGYTVLEFYRNYTSCDTADDRNIKHETSRVLWSWNDNDPVDNVPAFHQNQGSASLNLLGGQTNRPQDPPDAMTLAATVQNVTIPSVETTYWCSGFRIPQTFDSQEVYLTKFVPSISPGNEAYVQHFLIFVCDGLDGLDLQTEQGPCFSPSTDVRIQNCLGRYLIGGWALGGEGLTLPSNVGFPFGGPGFPRYIVTEIHYNNPDKVSGVLDNSGLIYTYTQTKREFVAGALQLGHLPRHNQIIPPGYRNYSSYGTCHSSCSSQYLPADGIHVIGNFFHTHLIGTGLELSVLRANSSLGDDCFDEIQLVERNLNYDYYYQQFTYVPQEVTIMPGDTLRLRCIYDSSNRSNVTVGGLSINYETCQSFLFYYPSVNLSVCQSLPIFNDVLSFVTEYVPQPLQQQVLAAIASDTSTVIRETLSQLEWTPEMIEAFDQNVYFSGNQRDFCFNRDGLITQPVSKTPEICNPLTEPVIFCPNRTETPGSPTTPQESPTTPASAASLISHFFLVVGLTFIALLVMVM